MSKLLDPFVIKAAKFIKTTGCYKQKDFEECFVTNHQGWGVIARSSDFKIENDHLLKSAAYINHNSKTIVIATVGTNFTINKQGFCDIIDDIHIVSGKIVPKFADVKNFVDQLIKVVGKEKLNEYKIITTGHSLGAVLSDMTAVYAKSKGLNVAESITFDNPGSKPIIENLLKQTPFSNLTTNGLKNEINFETYTSTPNIVNTCNEQIGTHYFAAQKKTIKKAKFDAGISFVSMFYNTGKFLVKTLKNFTNNNIEHRLDKVIFRLENSSIHKVSNKDWLNGKITVKLDKTYEPVLNNMDLKSKVQVSDKDYLKLTTTESTLVKINSEYLAMASEKVTPCLELGYNIGCHAIEKVELIGDTFFLEAA
jgi:hypothetical protein